VGLIPGQVKPCVHGIVSPIGSNNCTCDPGWVSINCDSECSDHGHISADKCICQIIRMTGTTIYICI
jgi:hypothetical protein